VVTGFRHGIYNDPFQLMRFSLIAAKLKEFLEQYGWFPAVLADYTIPEKTQFPQACPNSALISTVQFEISLAATLYRLFLTVAYTIHKYLLRKLQYQFQHLAILRLAPKLEYF